jgi:hypothetical protein
MPVSGLDGKMGRGPFIRADPRLISAPEGGIVAAVFSDLAAT